MAKKSQAQKKKRPSSAQQRKAPQVRNVGQRARNALARPRLTSAVNASMVVTRLGQSLANPFDQTECIPDGARGVGCFSTKNSISLSTGASGTCVFLAYAPRIGSQRLVYTSSTSGTIDTSSGWVNATQRTQLMALYAKYRSISAGVRCSYIGPTNSDAGFAIVGLVSGAVPVSTFNGLTAAQCADYCMSYKIIPVRNGNIATWRPVEFDNMSEWYPTNELASVTSAAIDVPYIIVAAGNLIASQGIFLVEAVSNFEGMFESQTFMPGGISNKPAVPAVSGWYEKVQDIVSEVASAAPLVGGIVNGYMQNGINGAIGAMANGVAYPPQLMNSGLPRAPRVRN